MLCTATHVAWSFVRFGDDRGLGFRGLGFRVQGLGVQGFRVQGFRVQGFGIKLVCIFVRKHVHILFVYICSYLCRS